MFREVRVYEIREVLRLWLRGEALRSIERLAGMDRKTVRRYVAAALDAGVDRDGDPSTRWLRRHHRGTATALVCRAEGSSRPLKRQRY